MSVIVPVHHCSVLTNLSIPVQPLASISTWVWTLLDRAAFKRDFFYPYSVCSASDLFLRFHHHLACAASAHSCARCGRNCKASGERDSSGVIRSWPSKEAACETCHNWRSTGYKKVRFIHHSCEGVGAGSMSLRPNCSSRRMGRNSPHWLVL